MNYDNIGKFIQERRKAKGLTQKELANKIGVTDKAVSKWETGLGCPDVSILEILSKELDCSILELLKGREIVDEVIPITEADDYIKTGLRYGENNFKRIISKVIAAIIIFIVSVLFLLNIVNMYNQRKTYWAENSTAKQIAERIDVLYKNISVIEKHQGIYSDEDYDTITTSLHKVKDSIGNNPYISYNGTDLTVNDFYIMDKLCLPYMYNISLYRLLAKYDKSIEKNVNVLIESIASRMYLSLWLTEEPNDLMYKYQLIKSDDIFNYDDHSIVARQIDLNYKLGLYVDVTNTIIEVGDIHE